MKFYSFVLAAARGETRGPLSHLAKKLRLFCQGVCAACGRKLYEVFRRMGLTGEGSGGRMLTNER